MANKITVKGTKSEIKQFEELVDHYQMASDDLEQRISRKNGFDDADKMFSSYLDESGWPYQSLIFDPRPYTVILEKAARLVGRKPKGKLVPREGGDSLGAYINNELLSFQWDDNTRLGKSMISKWITMDLNTRKYGASFGLVKWRYETKAVKGENGAKKEVIYDGPDFIVCNPRDVLANPSYEHINKWFQHREYLTLEELERVNDSARTAPIYKNLDLLKDAIKEKKAGSKPSADKRSSNYQIINKTLKGLDDTLGEDELYKTIEVCTEYRPSRWITYAPNHGVILRDIPNPYKHSEIPVVLLKYYDTGDDLYGLSELEPVSKLIRAINAHVSAYCDRVALRLRPPLHVNPVNVRMHTLDWAPEAKWLMNNPNVDVQTMKMESGEDTAFAQIYNILVGALLSAWGENSQGMSSQNPLQDQGRVTATEIQDSAQTRSVRDNMNQIYLSEALKKQIMFWYALNRQYMFQGSVQKKRVIRIVGRDAIKYFENQGLSDIRPTDIDLQQMMTGQLQEADVPPGPRYPVDLGDGLEVPKFQPDSGGEGGNLIIEEGDLLGTYDYIPDIESMGNPSDENIENKLMALLEISTNPVISQQLAAKGRAVNVEELLQRIVEATHVIKDADMLFEDLQNVQQTLPPGAGVAGAGVPPQGNGGNGGVAQAPPPMAPVANP